MPSARRWHRALYWGSLLVMLGGLATCTLGVLRSIHPPFWTLKAMADVAAFMEAEERGLPRPPLLVAVEGTYAHPLILWSKARVSGVEMPASLLHSGFGQRLLAYSEEPCRAARDFDTVVLTSDRALQNREWLAQEMREIRLAFACDGDGRLRPEHEGSWRDTTFRLHLHHTSGRTSTLDIKPSWTATRRKGHPANGAGGRGTQELMHRLQRQHAALSQPERAPSS